MRNHPEAGKVYWLRNGGEQSISWAAFQIDQHRPTQRVRVLALIGASRYIDQDHPCKMAREIYKDLLTRGFTQQASGPDGGIRWLRQAIYD